MGVTPVAAPVTPPASEPREQRKILRGEKRANGNKTRPSPLFLLTHGIRLIGIIVILLMDSIKLLSGDRLRVPFVLFMA